MAAHAAAGPSVINLLQSISSTSTAIFSNDANLSRLTLSPAPTNAANDSVDGTFEVGAPAPNVSVTGASARWGSRSAPLQTATDGVRLLPAGRNLDLPWFNINQIALTLSQPANASPGDVTVMGITGGSYGPVTISGSGTSTILITLAKGITSADRVTLTIANSQIIGYTRRLDVLPADVNDDGVVNTSDGLLILNHETPAHGYRAVYDLNGDGSVNTADFNLYRARIGTQLPSPLPQIATGGRGTATASLALDQLAPAIAASFNQGNSGAIPAQDWITVLGLQPGSASAAPPHALVTASLVDEVFSAAEHDLIPGPLSTLAARIGTDSKATARRAAALAARHGFATEKPRELRITARYQPESTAGDTWQSTQRVPFLRSSETVRVRRNSF